MDYKLELNEKQYAAVTTDKPYCRIIAGAGSGKTRVLTYRISYLVERRHVNPHTILAITFTNKAANEMKERVLRLLPDTFGVNVMTFHSFCARFLRREIGVLNISRNFIIIDADDQTKLIKNILKEEGYNAKDPIGKVIPGFISNKKNAGEYPDDVKINPLNPLERELLQLYRRYQAKLEETDSLDFDDLLLVTYQILRDYPEIRSRWQRYYSHILVDEFQDTNLIQYKLVRYLMNDYTNLYVVGDPDQTIYTWRGADQDIIMNLENDFPVETITLEENYRSTKEILDLANKLIKNNKKRIDKTLFTNIEGGEKVVCHCFNDQYAEARYVVDEIKKLTFNKYDYKDIVIMYRSNYLSLPYEKTLTQERIPYDIYGGLKFYQRKEVKDLLAYLRLIVNIKDDISWERIFNVPRRGIGDTTVEKLKDECLSRGMTFAEYIEQVENEDTSIPARQLQNMKNLVDLIKKYKELAFDKKVTADKIIDQLIEEIGYYNYLKSLDDNFEERISNAKTLVDDVAKNAGADGNLTLEEYMQNISLMSSQDYIEEKNKITLMTVHTAKGLEFPVVFLVSMNEGVFPNTRALEEKKEGIEEERRLCYVAFTRAMKKLYVTSYFNSFRGTYSVPSSFIKEAGLSEERKKVIKAEPVYKKAEPVYNARPKVAEPNDISWNVGDKVLHTAFGEGVVLEVDGKFIRVDFVEHGIKKMLASHPTLSRPIGGNKNEA